MTTPTYEPLDPKFNVAEFLAKCTAETELDAAVKERLIGFAEGMLALTSQMFGGDPYCCGQFADTITRDLEWLAGKKFPAESNERTEP